MKISVVLITFNEARNIERCLLSLGDIADEVVVMDSFSTDATEQIARRYGVHWVQHPFDGFAAQKNRANQFASYDWILSLDADEALSEPLRVALKQLKAQQGAADDPPPVWSLNRLTNYCGQWIRHGGWYPDRKVRLFDRRRVHWGGPNPHERLIIPPDTPVQHLQGDLLHYSYYTIEEHKARSRKYAEMAVAHLQIQGKSVGWWRVLVSPVARFVRHYFLKRGFLDGGPGFTIARISALEAYWKYKGLRKK
jgi:glycosyltransferase involved in cell wall biosynthesis